jgi:large subunit ribosomal protein L25
MANTIPFDAQPRDASLTNKALRRANKTPGVVYGRAYQATPVQFDSAAATKLVHDAGRSRLVSVLIAGSETAQDAFIREVQRDPVTNRVLHLDLYAVMADQVITNFVPLVTHGRAPVIEKGAVVVQMLDTLQVECLPRDMPASIAVDLTKLVELNSHITVADLTIPANVKVLADASLEIAHAFVPTIEVEEVAEPEAEGVEAAAGAAAPAGEGAAATTDTKPGKAEATAGKPEAKPSKAEGKAAKADAKPKPEAKAPKGEGKK